MSEPTQAAWGACNELLRRFDGIVGESAREALGLDRMLALLLTTSSGTGRIGLRARRRLLDYAVSRLAALRCPVVCITTAEQKRGTAARRIRSPGGAPCRLLFQLPADVARGCLVSGPTDGGGARIAVAAGPALPTVRRPWPAVRMACLLLLAGPLVLASHALGLLNLGSWLGPVVLAAAGAMATGLGLLMRRRYTWLLALVLLLVCPWALLGAAGLVTHSALQHGLPPRVTLWAAALVLLALVTLDWPAALLRPSVRSAFGEMVWPEELAAELVYRGAERWLVGRKLVLAMLLAGMVCLGAAGARAFYGTGAAGLLWRAQAAEWSGGWSSSRFLAAQVLDHSNASGMQRQRAWQSYLRVAMVQARDRLAAGDFRAAWAVLEGLYVRTSDHRRLADASAAVRRLSRETVNQAFAAEDWALARRVVEVYTRHHPSDALTHWLAHQSSVQLVQVRDVRFEERLRWQRYQYLPSLLSNYQWRWDYVRSDEGTLLMVITADMVRLGRPAAELAADGFHLRQLGTGRRDRCLGFPTDDGLMASKTLAAGDGAGPHIESVELAFRVPRADAGWYLIQGRDAVAKIGLQGHAGTGHRATRPPRLPAAAETGE